MTQKALLALADGSVFYGESMGAEGQAVGEVVFNTAMTGYQEILTDPSYTQQLVTLTYPHIGNVGVTSEDAESSAPAVNGLIIRDASLINSNWRSQLSLSDYLKQNQIIAIAGIDTRRLTRILREKGAQNGCIISGNHIDEAQAIAAANNFPGLKGLDLAKGVSTEESYLWKQGVWDLQTAYTDAVLDSSEVKYHVVAYDFGVKHNILRLLVQRKCSVTVVPATHPVEDVLAMNPDGVFLSNGPGDPEPCTYAISAIQSLLQASIPVFGICLGHQLLALACGAKTEKMKFGHHGANHPVKDLRTNEVLITSQNHGFAVDENSLPGNVKATHRSLFDGSLQGIELTDKPAFSFQGHPEASPGPHDVEQLFDRFIESMQQVSA
ncbi:MAG TPA: carbamoyl-phosphate synthase small subunit [Gammaproteobacteria bacterium]|nr:carbamoyl-phosphate synthase small subunit [Gammaproteobacteria bacterium]